MRVTKVEDGKQNGIGMYIRETLALEITENQHKGPPIRMQKITVRDQIGIARPIDTSQKEVHEDLAQKIEQGGKMREPGTTKGP